MECSQCNAQGWVERGAVAPLQLGDRWANLHCIADYRWPILFYLSDVCY